MDIKELIWYGEYTVKMYIQDLRDMELGLNKHYSEFSYSDYKTWKYRVINHFKEKDKHLGLEMERLFNRFEVKYDSSIFSEIIAMMKDDFDKSKKSDDVQTDINQINMDKQKSKVFIVHGHDDGLISQTEAFLMKLGFEPIILRDQVNQGQTIIEKLESNTDVAFAIVLYTACDQGRLNDENAPLKPRARQNVVFEHGFLNAKLGRKRVCALVDEGVEYPGDLSGVVYIDRDKNGAWKLKVAKEMQAAGLDVDLNKL